jgi:hypothetical protein
MTRSACVALTVILAIASRVALAQIAPGEIGGAGGRVVAPPFHPPLGAAPSLAPGIGLSAPGLGPALGIAPSWSGADAGGAGGSEPPRRAPTRKEAVAALRAALEEAREQDIDSLPVVQKFQRALSR